MQEAILKRSLKIVDLPSTKSCYGDTNQTILVFIGYQVKV